MSKYRDIQGNLYDEIPLGYRLATNEEIESYHSDNPVQLLELIVKPKPKGKVPNVFTEDNPIWGSARKYITTQKRYNGKLWDETPTYQNFKSGNDLAAKTIVSAYALPWFLGGGSNIINGFRLFVPAEAFKTGVSRAIITGLSSGIAHGLTDNITRSITASPENNYKGYTFPELLLSHSVDPNAGIVAEFIHPGTLVGGTITPLAKKGKDLYNFYKALLIDEYGDLVDKISRQLALRNRTYLSPNGFQDPDSKFKFVIGDIYKANKPVEFLNLVPEEDLVRWIRLNMDSSLENALERGENGAFKRLGKLYDQAVESADPKAKEIISRYLDVLFSGTSPTNMNIYDKLALLGGKLNGVKVQGMPVYYFNIKPRPRAFGLNYDLGPLSKNKQRRIHINKDNAQMDIFTKEYGYNPNNNHLEYPYVESHEQMHGLVSPYKPYTKLNLLFPYRYFEKYNNTELLARFLLLLNAGGAKSGNNIMSPKLFKWWANNYVRLMEKAYPETRIINNDGFVLDPITDEFVEGVPIEVPKINVDNNMTDFFNLIPEESIPDFINWANPQVLKHGGTFKSHKRTTKRGSSKK